MREDRAEPALVGRFDTDASNRIGSPQMELLLLVLILFRCTLDTMTCAVQRSSVSSLIWGLGLGLEKRKRQIEDYDKFFVG